MPLPPGLYDRVVTDSLALLLGGAPEEGTDLEPLDSSEVAIRLAEVFGQQLQRVLEDINRNGADRALSQLSLVNELLVKLREFSKHVTPTDAVHAPPTALRSIRAGAAPKPIVPATGLSAPWLFTAGRGSPSLLEEVNREASNSDQIDVLVSFITVSGVRKLRDTFNAITAASATGAARTRIRVLTTTYVGATEVGALDELARLNGCEVRVSHDGRRSRLHAKAWIFKRRTGFGSAYVGSANLSRAAMMGGIEWTVKFTQAGQSNLFERAQAHFDTLWEDAEFRPYHPENVCEREAVIAALRRERGGQMGEENAPLIHFDITPKHYQQEILDALANERAHGRMKNLVVAATGTGKTVIAALDYRRTRDALGSRPRLLFVAHREEILQQALQTYRAVLRDHSFGELLTGGARSRSHDHVFASIDHVSNHGLVEKLGADYWDTVVIDECHHLAADRLDKVATTVRPRVLLGLTATPERADGVSIERYFSPKPDGSPAAELRLWDALDMQILAPFEYFACDDDTDFTSVPWGSLGRETQVLDTILTGNKRRAQMVIDEWERLTGGAAKSRALVFCVNVAHAEFMAAQFTAAGLKVVCLTGTTDRLERRSAPSRLERGEISAIVTVDLFNEGVDVPTADTLLLLRPTQSPVLFQQQIGRGLRLSPGKESCLVLDFVGRHRVEFRFDHLLASLTGQSRHELTESVESGFSALAPGCSIHLAPQARQQVLQSLRSVTHHRWRSLAAELRGYVALRRDEPLSLAKFVHDQRLPLEEIYRTSSPSGWTSLRRSAGLIVGEELPGEGKLSARFGDLLHLMDAEQVGVLKRVAENGSSYRPSSPTESLRAQMLTYQVDSSRQPVPFERFVLDVSEQPNCLRELGELAQVLEARAHEDAPPLEGMEDVPLRLHLAYTRREILTAVGYLSATRRTPHRSGIYHLPGRNIELMFVTLDKSAGFHDRIAYHDYAVSPTRFHWQTQNTAGPSTASGIRYLESSRNGWTFHLFVRESSKVPYRACGATFMAEGDEATGDRPMSLTWTLKVPLPAELFRKFSVLRGA